MKRKTPWSLMLAMLMLIQLALPTSWAKAGGGGPEPFPSAWWTASVTDGERNSLEDAEIRNGTEVWIDYTVTVPQDQDVDAEKPYLLTTLPDGFALPADETIELRDNTDLHLATVSISSGGLITIEFTQAGAELDEIRGQFLVKRTFDKSQVIDREEIVFDVGAKGTITIRIEQPPVINASINKANGQYDPNTGEITWTITIDPGSTPISNVKVVDRPDGHQEIVVGSAQIAGSDTASCAYGQDPETETDVLTCTFPEMVSEPQVITYNTKVKTQRFGLSTLSTITMRNSADLLVDEEKVVSASATYGDLSINWIEKAGRLVQETEDGELVSCTAAPNNANGCEIEWTITVNKDKQWIPDGTRITDDLPQYLAFVEGSVFVTVGVEPTQPLSTPVAGQFAYLFDQDTQETYTFTFRTSIDPAYYTQQSQLGFANTAELVYQGAVAKGTARVTAKQGPGVPTSLIEKSGAGYDPRTQEITWRITVNSNKVNISNATVTDTIPAGQELVADSLLVNGILVAPQYEDKDRLLTINLGDLDPSNSPQVIEFKTKVTRPEHFATNSSVPYSNTATLAGGGINKSSSSATQQVESTVLTKNGTDYDYSTHLLTWEITVNENNMALNSVVVTDEIPVGQEFVPGSVTVSGPAEWTSAHSDGTLTIELGNIGATHTITFQTKITDINFFAKNVSKDFANTAKLIFTVPDYPDYNGDVQVSARRTITNKLVDKQALSFDEKEAFIDWEVPLNSGLLSLVNASISDQLQTGLELDAESVKLYKGTVDPRTGSVSKDPEQEVPLSWDGGATPTSGSASYASGKFVLNLPTPTNDAYVLTFRTDLIGSFSKVANEIKMSGTGVTESSKVEKNWRFDLAGWASGRSGSITVVKVDANHETTRLPGAVFELLDSKGNLLREARTNEAGEALFDRLKFRTFYIREKEAPEGYQRSTELLPFTLSGDEGQTEIVRHFKNEPLKRDIQFLKAREGTDRPLYGAEFTLYREGQTQPLMKAVSDRNGQVLFAGVEAGHYTIRESKAPPGYFLSDQEHQIEVRLIPGNQLELVGVPERIENKPRPVVPGPPPVGRIVFFKTDMEQKPLAGAEFTLYDANGNAVKSAVSSADGTVTFTSVPMGAYTIRETAAPSGYQIADEVIQVWVEADSTVVMDHDTIVNSPEPVTPVDPVHPNPVDPNPVDPNPVQPNPADPNGLVGRLVINKTGEANNPLPGAEFTLYDAQNKAVATAVSDAQGRVLFDKVPNGAYTIWETKAPAGYQRSTQRIAVTIDGSLEEQTFTFPNAKLPLEVVVGAIRIVKVDQENRPLAGATFALVDDNGQVVQTGTSGQDGIVLFTGVPFGKYSIRETEAPEGYKLLTEDLTVEVTAATPIELTVENRDRKQLEFGDKPGTGPGDRPKDDQGGTLPESGGVLDTKGLVLIGLGLILSGALLAAFSRKRKAGTAH